jgi:hypothetical protein
MWTNTRPNELPRDGGNSDRWFQRGHTMDVLLELHPHGPSSCGAADARWIDQLAVHSLYRWPAFCALRSFFWQSAS